MVKIEIEKSEAVHPEEDEAGGAGHHNIHHDAQAMLVSTDLMVLASE